MNPKIIPSDVVAIVDDSDLLFFLGGPIQGGGDWQRDAISLIATLEPDAFIACPKTFLPEHPLYKFQLSTPCRADLICAGLPISFGESPYWERFYLAKASKQGCIIFWLPEEDKNNPRPRENGPYGRDSYGELGEWRARMKYERAKVVVGGSPNFSGLSVIEENFKAMVNPNFVVHRTLEDTIHAAIEVAKR